MSSVLSAFQDRSRQARNLKPGEAGVALIAEDDDLMRRTLRYTLEEYGYQVVETNNGQECLEQYEQLNPDIILLDCTMPIMNGYTCCEQLRMLDKAAHTPIVMITGLDGDSSIQRAFASGATDYVLKPVQWKIFAQRITKLIEQTKLMRQLAEQNAEYRQEMMVDDLTKVLNRRAFDRYLQQEWQRSMREQKPFSVILADVDFFKIYNDTFGHVAADRHLQQVAQIMRHAVYRATDLVCRYGGEEFGILLPNTSVDGAVQVAVRIQTALKDFYLDRSSSASTRPITLSYGISGLIPAQNMQPVKLVEAADKALYQAKENGRNCISVRLLEFCPVAK
ncbi:diguanylate cyclase domain-containing protein [Altericista sp. CCNU0014]|uniref:GGDEF domain-containing response regulator n=1 Tax=Altericista sp. CCNU0014 TaxID=3082949 RepID=UPI00384D7DE5